MNFVQGPAPKSCLIATRRQKRYQRPFRCFYVLPDYPGLLLQTQGHSFTDATLEELLATGRPLLFNYSPPHENSPARWREVMPELANEADITHKVSLFLPEEKQVAEVQDLCELLAKAYRGELATNMLEADRNRQWERLGGK